MVPRRFFFVVSFVRVGLLWSVLGCGPEVVLSDPSAVDDSSDAAGSGVGEPSVVESCNVLCNQREWNLENVASGHCPFSSSALPQATCKDYCEERARRWSTDELDVFGRCMLGDPLCYITIDECTQHEL